MIKPNEDVIQALTSLDNNQAWQTIKKWMYNSLIQQSVNNCKNRGEETIITQGKCLELQEILKYSNSASDYIMHSREDRDKEDILKR